MSCQKTKKMRNRNRPSLQKKQGAKPLQPKARMSYGEILAGYDLKMRDILARASEKLEVSV